MTQKQMYVPADETPGATPAYIEPDLVAETEQELKEEAAKLAAPVEASTTADKTLLAMLRIAESMEAFMKRQESTRQLSILEVAPVSPWNPEGRKDHPKFSRPTCVQGIQVDSFQHTAEEVKLFNQLKPGRYCNRVVEVQRLSDGTINLQWPGMKLDKRIAFYAEFPTIGKLLEACIAERAKKEADRKAGRYEDTDEL